MNCLIEEIINSLEIIIRAGIASQIEGTKKTNHIKVIDISNLSANKSRRAPKEVSVEVSLAI